MSRGLTRPSSPKGGSISSSSSSSTRSNTESFFDAGCAQLEAVVRGSMREAVAAELSEAATLSEALEGLRASLRANVLRARGGHIALERVVNAFDRETRQEGFHVLHDWDGRADSVLEDTIPIDVLNYVAGLRGGDPPDRTVVAILVDYYLLHLLSLFALRIWDGGDPDANLDRLDALVQDLQGPDGSGQLFVRDAETLILIATSHFELQERGYDRLLARVRRLNRAHQSRIALGHASSMGSHLRFGFEATYARDTTAMRDDNVADYPWLCYALMTVMTEYARFREGAAPTAGGAEPDRLVEALLNGLSGDARAFVGAPSGLMSRCEADRLAFREAFLAHRAELLEQFERFRPSEQQYSPLSLFFNFSHNILKGTVVDALLRSDPWRLTFNDLLTSLPSERGEEEGSDGGEQGSAARELLARTLMTYARLNPDRIRGKLMPVIVYDPAAGRQAFGTTLRRLKGS